MDCEGAQESWPFIGSSMFRTLASTHSIFFGNPPRNANRSSRMLMVNIITAICKYWIFSIEPMILILGHWVRMSPRQSLYGQIQDSATSNIWVYMIAEDNNGDHVVRELGPENCYMFQGIFPCITYPFFYFHFPWPLSIWHKAIS